MIPSTAEFVQGRIGRGDKILVNNFYQNYKKEVLPKFKKVPKVVIQGDFHPGNIIIDKETEKIIGIIDFGCCGMGYPGYDLGTIIYHLLEGRKKCEFEDIGEVLVGFCEVHPLSQEEIDYIYYCIGARALLLYR